MEPNPALPFSTSRPREDSKSRVARAQVEEPGVDERRHGRRTHLNVVLLITPLRSNLASTAKHHASAVDTMIRSCVSRARENGEALGRANATTTVTGSAQLCEFHLNFVEFANQKIAGCRIVDVSFQNSRAAIFVFAFSFVASRYKAWLSLASHRPHDR